MSQNKEKRAELESQAAEIQEQLTETVTEYKKVGNQMLIAGGIVAGGYLLYSMFSDSKKKGSFVSDAIKSYALALALSYAKDLLIDYLASLEAETETASNGGASSLGNMNGALNASPKAILAHIRNGNTNGLGILDFTTRRAFDKFDFDNSFASRAIGVA